MYQRKGENYMAELHVYGMPYLTTNPPNVSPYLAAHPPRKYNQSWRSSAPNTTMCYTRRSMKRNDFDNFANDEASVSEEEELVDAIYCHWRDRGGLVF
jgi:hypothetical protein